MSEWKLETNGTAYWIEKDGERVMILLQMINMDRSEFDRKAQEIVSLLNYNERLDTGMD